MTYDYDEATLGPLMEALGVDEVGNIVNTLAENLPEQMKELHEALATENWHLMGDVAHSIKGSSQSLGFTSISDAAYALEMACKEGLPGASIMQSAQSVIHACNQFCQTYAQVGLAPILSRQSA